MSGWFLDGKRGTNIRDLKWQRKPLQSRWGGMWEFPSVHAHEEAQREQSRGDRATARGGSGASWLWHWQ